jgi:nucleotide-binding universal stress UspA family protein
MQDINKILVVSTSTSTCKKAIHYGVTLAKQVGAKLYVLHSDYDPFDLEGWGLPIPSLQTLRDNYLGALEADRKMLNKLIETEKSPGMEVSVSVTDQPIVKEVPKMVQEEHIDLIIMVGFEEGRLEHFLFSSSNHQLVRTMPCSILLVKEHRDWEET